MFYQLECILMDEVLTLYLIFLFFCVVFLVVFSYTGKKTKDGGAVLVSTPSIAEQTHTTPRVKEAAMELKNPTNGQIVAEVQPNQTNGQIVAAEQPNQTKDYILEAVMESSYWNLRVAFTVEYKKKRGDCEEPAIQLNQNLNELD